MDAQIHCIAAALAGVDLVGIDDVDITGLRVIGPIFKNAGRLAFYKQQQFHGLVPVGRCVGCEVMLVLDPESSLIQIG